MKRLIAALLLLAAVVALPFGLLFLVGADGQLSRYLIGAIAMVLGALCAAFGARLLKAARAADPDRIAADILAAAKTHNGELSAQELMAHFGDRYPAVEPVLSRMVDTGACERRHESGGVYYVFEHLQPRIVVRRCQFCEAELPLSGEVSNCPNCGGQVSKQVAKLSTGDEDYYGLDE